MSTYYQRPLTSDEIYHHGILGQKWGKKNGPPYPLKAENHSSSEKKAGYQKSIDGKYGLHTIVKDSERHKNENKVDAAEDKAHTEVDKKIKRPEDTYDAWYKKNGHLKKHAKEYMDAHDKVDNDFHKKRMKAYNRDNENIKKAKTKLFNNEQIKKELEEAKKLNAEDNKIKDKYLGPNSNDYKQAMKNYIKMNNGEYDDYGFNHYYWGGVESGPEYFKAYAKYEKESKSINEEYNKRIEKIIDIAVADSPIKSFTKEEIEFGKYEVHHKILFGY